MKKVFSIKVENKKPARQVDAIKHEIKKYVARERRKDLPEGSDFWDFNCKIGLAETDAQEVHLSQVNKSIDQLATNGAETFYLEVLAKPRKRQSKSK